MHSPEFDFEKDRVRVERYAKKFEKTGPIYIDNDLSYFKAIGATYWPQFFLVDKQGQVRAFFEGEMNAQRPEADSVHRMIQALLEENLLEEKPGA